MKKLFNLSIYNFDWFNNDWEQVEDFCRKNELAGIELLAKGLVEDPEFVKKIPPELVKGVHLSYYLNWLPIEVDVGQRISQEEIIGTYRRELKLAEELKVDYVVFHASNTDLKEILSGNFKYENSVILSKVAKVINKVVADLDINFKLLFENLWWTGLTFLDKSEAVDFLQKIDYENLGFLLDTGHLMNTNLQLKDETAGINYIQQVLSKFGETLELFHGVHLHKSLSGSYRQQNREEFYQKFMESDDIETKEKLAEEFISKSDQHLPFSESPQQILKLINPSYVIHEFTCTKKDKFIDYLQTQESNL